MAKIRWPFRHPLWRQAADGVEELEAAGSTVETAGTFWNFLVNHSDPKKCLDAEVPIGSMYAIYGNIYHQYTPNVSIYTIHGSYGLHLITIFLGNNPLNIRHKGKIKGTQTWEHSWRTMFWPCQFLEKSKKVSGPRSKLCGKHYLRRACFIAPALQGVGTWEMQAAPCFFGGLVLLKCGTQQGVSRNHDSDFAKESEPICWGFNFSCIGLILEFFEASLIAM